MKSLNKDVADLVQSPLGSASAPSISFVGDPNTGIYSPGADQVAISTGGTGRLFVDASGRVGIGTSGPNVLLHLDSAPAGTGSAGVIGFGDASNYRFAEIEGYREGGSFAGSLIFRTQTSGGISAAGSERLRITSAGLVGIGTSSPTTALTVGGVTPALSLTYNFPLNNTAGALISSVRFGDGDPGREATATISSHVDSLWSAGSGPTALRFNTAPAGSVTALPRMTIDSAGRVGIGTAVPADYHPDATNLVVASSATSGITIASSTAGNGNIFFADGTSSSTEELAGYIQYGHGDNSLKFGTTATERARIDSSGRVLVGTSSQQQLGGRDQVLQFRTAGYAAASVVGTIDNFTGPWFTLAKARGGATPTAVGPGDQLGVFNFVGYDGTSWGSIGASIEAWVDGTTGTNDMPCRLVFFTTADGAASPTERMRITSAGLVGIGTTSPGSILHLSAVNPEFRFQGTNGTGATHKFRTTGLNDQSLQITSADDLYINASAHVFRSQNEATERCRIDSSGRLLVGTSTNTGGSLLQVNDNRIRIATAKTPASATDTGSAGEICWDANYIYVCTATNTWKRTAIATW